MPLASQHGALGSVLAVVALCAVGCSSGGVERCFDNERLEGSDCVAVCSQSERLLEDGRCEPRCKAGQVVAEGECRAPCPAGEEYFGGVCVTSCSAVEQRVDGECRGPAAIRLNSVGYPPVSEKLAVSSADPGLLQVVAEDGEVVLSGNATGPTLDPITGLELWRFDFSDVELEGSFTLVSENTDPSPKFRIGQGAYREALGLAMLGFYGLRCGTEVELAHGGDVFQHAACHLNDSLGEVESERPLPSLGGWHDAGDYGKYTQNGAFSAGILLLAWEHFGANLRELELPALPEHGGELPDFLDEVKWELDWLFTMQLDDGSTYHKLTALGFEGFVLPERDISSRYMAPPSTEATASFVAVMAQAARVYEAYDAAFARRCLQAAERGYAFLSANPGHLSPDLSDFSTGAYLSDDADDRLWAAAELWVTTGDDAALADFEARAEGVRVEDDWDWAQLSNMGVFSYLSASRGGGSSALRDALGAAVLASADRLVATADADPFLRALGNTYYWGANGLVARSILNLAVAHRLTGFDDYRRTALHQLDHLLGLNAQGRSFVTGLGFLPPLFPHHRPSGADSVEAPWPGLLVGGPNPQLPRNEPQVASVVSDPDAPAPLMWQDAQASYWSNEIAVNWNAPLVYGLAWFAGP